MITLKKLSGAANGIFLVFFHFFIFYFLNLPFTKEKQKVLIIYVNFITEMQSFKRLKIQTHFELLRNVPSKLPTNYQMKKLSRGLSKKKLSRNHKI